MKLQAAKRAMREPWGTAGLLVAMVALVTALAGAAYAASGGGLSHKQKKEVEKIAKKFAGKDGAPGAAGTNGTNGKDGTNGTNGQDGVDGKSVTVATEQKGANCKEGGASFEAEGSGVKKFACNGSPWTAGGTLPSGATEQGEWALIGDASGAFLHYGDAISFGIPLETAPAVHYLRENGMEPFYNAEEEKEEERTQPECPGTAAEPLAEPGSLCIYASKEENIAKNPFGSLILPTVCPFGSAGFCVPGGTADKGGFGVVALSKEAAFVNAAGTWAVTAE